LPRVRQHRAPGLFETYSSSEHRNEFPPQDGFQLTARLTGVPPCCAPRTDFMREALSPATKDATPQEIIADVKEFALILRRGWRLIALCCVICLALAVVYLAAAKRVYRATARLLVLQHGGRPLNMANNDPNRLMEGNDDYIPTHALIISSPLVVMRAIER